MLASLARVARQALLRDFEQGWRGKEEEEAQLGIGALPAWMQLGTACGQGLWLLDGLTMGLDPFSCPRLLGLDLGQWEGLAGP